MSSGIFKVINNMKKYTFLLILSIQPRNKNDINFALLRFVCLRIHVYTSNNQRLQSAGDDDRRPKHFCSNAVLCASLT